MWLSLLTSLIFVYLAVRECMPALSPGGYMVLQHHAFAKCG